MEYLIASLSFGLGSFHLQNQNNRLHDTQKLIDASNYSIEATKLLTHPLLEIASKKGGRLFLTLEYEHIHSGGVATGPA